MNPKTYLQIELGTSPAEIRNNLQKIKDAMATAMMQKIELAGIQDATDTDFETWQYIYLQANNLASTHTG